MIHENVKENGVAPPYGYTWFWRCGWCGTIGRFVHQSEAEREARAHNRLCSSYRKMFTSVSHG